MDSPSRARGERSAGGLNWAECWFLLRAELRYLLRDPTALLLMIGLPILLYPLVFGLGTVATKTGGEQMARAVLPISVPAELQAWIEEEDAIEVRQGEVVEEGEDSR